MNKDKNTLFTLAYILQGKMPAKTEIQLIRTVEETILNFITENTDIRKYKKVNKKDDVMDMIKDYDKAVEKAIEKEEKAKKECEYYYNNFCKKHKKLYTCHNDTERCIERTLYKKRKGNVVESSDI